MKHDKAIDLLEHHATNCEQNAAIQEREGQYEDAANSRSNAADYRQAISSLHPVFLIDGEQVFINGALLNESKLPSISKI
ncbi:hypothetical protein KKQ10_24605 [Pseudomonas sp. MG-9]|uniref:hypothetical protein n=1 Tax=Pseudomonas sp. MG-9 TaxID=2839032 RepID=UPI001C0041A5|nr:hypothetical protein [Pseudomonas sp. MG-9]MBT9268061.1 hypothetical protein [Pseudomonas sp. MG-9]